MYEHTDHVMDEQMNFIVHFDWMSFSDGVVPIYSLKSRHEKRQDKKHSHYPLHAGQTHVTLATWGQQLRPSESQALSPPNPGDLPSQASGSSCLRPGGLTWEAEGLAMGSLPGRPPPLQVGSLSSLKGSKHLPLYLSLQMILIQSQGADYQLQSQVHL